VRPLASAWFLQDSHIHSIRIELSGMEVEEPSGKLRSGNAAMDGVLLIVAASMTAARRFAPTFRVSHRAKLHAVDEE